MNNRPYIEDGPEGVSTWVARYENGDVLSSAFGDTFAQMRETPGILSLALYRGGEEKMRMDIPYGESPYFLRRVKANLLFEADGPPGMAYEWGACIGSEDANGALDLRWLLHDGSVISSETIDIGD